MVCDDGRVSVVIRRPGPDELAEVGRLTVDAYAADGAVSADDPYFVMLADAAGRDRAADLLVAVSEQGALLGTVTYVVPGSALSEVSTREEAEIRMLAVAPAARGCGIGEQLTRACVDRARAEGFAVLVLSTATWMHAAHRLYRRLGFVRVPERDWKPRTDVDLLVYALDL